MHIDLVVEVTNFDHFLDLIFGIITQKVSYFVNFSYVVGESCFHSFVLLVRFSASFERESNLVILF